MVSKEENENNLPVYLLVVDHFAANKTMKSFSVKCSGEHNTTNFLQLLILTMGGITQTFARSSPTQHFFNNLSVICISEIVCGPSCKDSSIRVNLRVEPGGSFPRYLSELSHQRIESVSHILKTNFNFLSL